MARTSSRNSSSFFKRFGGSGSSSHLQSDVLGIAGSMFRGRQAAGAEKIASVADAARKLSEDLSDIPSVQSYVESAADQMEYLSDYVAENSLEQMVDDGAAFALGYGFTKLMTGDDSSERNVAPRSRRKTAKNAGRPPQARKRSAASAKKAKANGKDGSHAAASAS
jgi:hypothetical protein